MRGRFGPSIQQRRLLHYVRQLYPEAQLDWKIRIVGRRYSRWADVAIVSKNICIEYDGKAFHRNKLKDRKRDLELKMMGWRTIRVNKDNWNFFMLNMAAIINGEMKIPKGGVKNA
jgi:very-short-patch-repair endonuclease